MKIIGLYLKFSFLLSLILTTFRITAQNLPDGIQYKITGRLLMDGGEGSKTVLPSKAYAKVSCRLVPHQDHHKISQMFADYILSIAPDTVQVKVTPMHGGQGYVCPISLPAYQAAEKGFEIAFGKKPLAVRRGGSIPIISTFEQVLGIKTVLMGFGLESNAIHSPNENCSLDIFRKGIEAVIEFHQEYARR